MSTIIFFVFGAICLISGIGIGTKWEREQTKQIKKGKLNVRY